MQRSHGVAEHSMSEDDAAERDPSEDDDWFERALEDESSDQSNEAGADDETATSADADTEAQASAADDGGASPSVDEQASAEGPSDGFEAADTDTDELDAAFEAATEAASEGDEAGDPFASEGTDDFGLGRSSSPAAGGSGGEDLFEDDFASAFGGGGESEEFDDADFESDIPRIDIGIEGLDRMIRGGVPERHLMVAIGSAGTGKTTFGLQYLNHGLENGDNCVFITLEQTHESILDTAAEFDWDFEGYEADDQLAVIDLDPIEMANSLDNIRAELPSLIEDFGADRFVLDSVSLLEMMYDEQARRRTEVFDFTKSLKRAGVTTLLTSEAHEDNPYASRHGIIEYLTDAVFILQYVRAETRETRLAVEIQKIRNANHSRETKPYEITDDGIDVYEQANIF